MFPIPPAEVWAAAPKDVRWWASVIPTGDVDYDECPGHGYVTKDGTGDLEYCDGSCITDEPTDADEEPGVIR